MIENANTKRVAKRYYRKKSDLFSLLEKIKLWPSRSGRLHGLKTVEIHGDTATLTTHCGESYVIHNSRNSRAARWLRNKYYTCACKSCKVPDWKLAKYGQTFFSRGHGAFLKKRKIAEQDHAA
jgi:pyrrolysyl-tRNA synthetase-like protein